MNRTSKFICVLLSLIMAFGFCTPAFAAQSEAYVITSPYDNVDFSALNQYKTALHTHTNASDGKITLAALLERHAEAGFDIVAVTDHGTVDYGWTNENPNKFIHGALKLLGKSKGKLKCLGQSGEFSNGISYEVVTRNGDDYLVLSSGSEIMRLPYGIENNAVSVNAHVNSWFVDYCNNSIAEYKDAVSGVSANGGVCVINHPGEYTKARYELHSQAAYSLDNFSYNYYINKFAELIDAYEACIGIDINSKCDNRTRYDRILWDELLGRFSKNGENVYAIASSDAHIAEIADSGFVYLLMEDKTSANAQNAIKNGLMFPASHCIGNYDELVEIAESLKELYGETELYTAVSEAAEAINLKVKAIESGSEKVDSSIETVYTVLDEDGYCTAETQPMITDICVDGDKITISTENAAIVRFISNGKTICTKRSDEAEITLSDYSDCIGDYVRAEVFGEGGIVYTEPFLINAGEKTEKVSVINGEYTDYGILDFIFATLHNWFNVINIFFGKIFR